MHWIDWTIVLIPLAIILGLAVYSRRYVRGIADFLAAGRVAGRYVISVGDMQASLAVITLVALCEQQYRAGMAMSFWHNTTIPIGIFVSLTGYLLYRYRETRSLSLGQFLETRYNRPLRVIAAFIRTLAEMMANAIGPAVASRFFIYFLGLPFTLEIWGFKVPTFGVIMFIILALAMVIIWSGGRISLLITDSIQGLMSYPIFVIFTIFILTEISWNADVAPVMLDRAAGESFLNPMDISKLRDFNIFALVVTITGFILNRGAWIGNGLSSSGRTAHEQKMAGILGAWRNGFSTLMMTLLSVFIITVMLSDKYSNEAKDIRNTLISKVAEETIVDSDVRQQLIYNASQIDVPKHVIGVDEPYSRVQNPDILYLQNIQKTLKSSADQKIKEQQIDETSMESALIQGECSATFQGFSTLYYQMMMPSLLRTKLPMGIMGLFVLLMVMLMLSTDDSRIFNASSTIIQDVIMPFRKKAFERKQHLQYLKWMSVAVCIFFFMASLFFTQLDFISMFINIMTSLWLGAAGPIMVGGLYTKWGTTTGAFCALIFGSGTALSGLIFQRTWADKLYPWLSNHKLLEMVQSGFDGVNSLFAPIIEWHVTPDKFPINSFEIYFLAMMLGCGAYTIGSILTYKKPFNMDKMLHRGIYADEGKKFVKERWTLRNVFSKILGITSEYSRGDKTIAWGVFGYSIVYQIGVAFIGVLIWNMISPWPAEWWGMYFFISLIVVGIIVGVISSVWFFFGTIIDLKKLFKALSERVDNPLDDGWVDKS